MALTIEEICKEIKADFKNRRITQQFAADQIKTTKQNIANQLSGKKKFSANMARKFSDAFGYSLEWLLYGEGFMYKDGMGAGGVNADGLPYYYLSNVAALLNEGKKLRMAERLIDIQNDKVAISAFRAILYGNYEEYEDLCSILESRYSYNIPQSVANDPKTTQALRYARQYFTDVETKAAKELVIIEQKAALGEIIDVDAEMKRFRRRLLLIKDSYRNKAFEKNPNLNPAAYITNAETDEIQELVPEKYRDKPTQE